MRCALLQGRRVFGSLRSSIGFLALLVLGFASTLACANQLTAIPALHAHVTDTTQTLNDEQRRSLEDALTALEQRKGAQFAVLMIPTLAPPADIPADAESIESYAVRGFEQYKLGHKGVDDGLLLLIVKDDSRVRIEVGYGLEGTIPDVIAARVIREYITPRFRNGDIYGGIRDAMQVLVGLVDGVAMPEALEGPRVVQPTQQAGDDFKPPWWLTTIGACVVAMVGALFLAALLQSMFNFFPVHIVPIAVRRVAGALAAPAILAFLYSQPWPEHLPVLVVPQWLLAAAIAGSIGWFIVPRNASNRWAGGMTWGEFFTELLAGIFWIIVEVLLSAITGGSSSSSSSSSSGFSGGGGSSGGGGASGRW